MKKEAQPEQAKILDETFFARPTVAFHTILILIAHVPEGQEPIIAKADAFAYIDKHHSLIEYKSWAEYKYA